MTPTVFSIGHSNHDIDNFIRLLRSHGITAIADVRSHPYSRFASQYSREALKAFLAEAGIAYVFLGTELGARSDDPACYLEGRVQYDRLAKQPCFGSGIRRIAEGGRRFRIALMCAEKDPADCHRALLVGRALFESGICVTHIHASGGLENQEQLETRLLALCHLPDGDMFKSREQFIADAYYIQAQRVAYLNEDMENITKVAAA